MDRHGDHLRQPHRKEEQRRPEHQPHRPGIHPHLSAECLALSASCGGIPHRSIAPAPDEQVEDDDVDDAVEDAGIAQDRLLKRYAHEPRIGENRREAERTPHVLVPMTDDKPRKDDQDGVDQHGKRERDPKPLQF